MTIKYDVQDFIPLDDRVMVQPGPVQSVVYEAEVPDESTIKNQKKGIPTVNKTKKVEQEATINLRVGQVVSIEESTNPDVTVPYKEGDWIVYTARNATKFDLLTVRDEDPDCPVLLRRYEILAKLNDDAINKIITYNNRDNNKNSENGEDKE